HLRAQSAHRAGPAGGAGDRLLLRRRRQGALHAGRAARRPREDHDAACRTRAEPARVPECAHSRRDARRLLVRRRRQTRHRRARRRSVVAQRAGERPMIDRRSFLKALGASAVLSRSSAWTDAQARGDGWSQVPGILARIKPPTFPSRDFDVTAFGAVGNNSTDNSEAFRRAIADCVRAGGGRVVVPKGEFLTGAIGRKSGVNLHVTADATFRFTRDLTRYTRALPRYDARRL